MSDFRALDKLPNRPRKKRKRRVVRNTLVALQKLSKSTIEMELDALFKPPVPLTKTAL